MSSYILHVCVMAKSILQRRNEPHISKVAKKKKKIHICMQEITSSCFLLAGQHVYFDYSSAQWWLKSNV